MALKLTNTVVNKVTNIVTGNQITDIIDADNTYDQRVYGIAVQCDDTSAQDLTLYLHDGANSRQLCIVQIPINSGNTNAIAALSVTGSSMAAAIFKQKDNAGVSFFNLQKGYKLQAKIGAITSGKSFNVLVNAEKYDG